MKTLKIVTNLPEPIQEVKIKKLFSYMGHEFAYVLRPFIYMNTDSVSELPAIVEVSTGYQADSIVRPSNYKATMKDRIQAFKDWMDKNVTEEVFAKELAGIEKINIV